MEKPLCSDPFAHRLTVSVAILMCAVAAAEARVQEEGTSEANLLIRHVVIEAAAAQTPRSDTASIAELSDGRLMVVYLEYNNRHHHFGERTPLAAALSSDHGKTWQILGKIADDPEAEYTNLDCLFTSKGDAVLTYMYAKPAWNRSQIRFKAALIPRKWLRIGT